MLNITVIGKKLDRGNTFYLRHCFKGLECRVARISQANAIQNLPTVPLLWGLLITFHARNGQNFKPTIPTCNWNSASCCSVTQQTSLTSNLVFFLFWHMPHSLSDSIQADLAQVGPIPTVNLIWGGFWCPDWFYPIASTGILVCNH